MTHSGLPPPIKDDEHKARDRKTSNRNPIFIIPIRIMIEVALVPAF